MPGRIDVKLAELDITLPSPMPPIANYVPYVITGKLGAGVSIERGKEAYGSASSACWRS